MNCDVCGSDDIYAESSYQNWKYETVIVFDCRACGFYHHTVILSELRANKINKILNKK